jgi:hypothetical protein
MISSRTCGANRLWHPIANTILDDYYLVKADMAGMLMLNCVVALCGGRFFPGCLAPSPSQSVPPNHIWGQGTNVRRYTSLNSSCACEIGSAPTDWRQCHALMGVEHCTLLHFRQSPPASAGASTLQSKGATTSLLGRHQIYLVLSFFVAPTSGCRTLCRSRGYSSSSAHPQCRTLSWCGPRKFSINIRCAYVTFE